MFKLYVFEECFLHVSFVLFVFVLVCLFVFGDTKQSRLKSTTEIMQNKHVKVLHYFVDDIK